jgi:hypothetical protein
MNISSLSIPLSTSPVQVEKLLALQEAFALVCNTLAPVVRDTRCWSRVALHHMMYRTLREQFPLVGSQMVCNAIYSVSRTSRLIFQSEQSPFHVQHFSDKALPLLQFLPTAPVYFDRHTVSIKPGSLSMYTLDGRMRFEVNLSPEDMLRFKTAKLHEVVLNRVNERFVLNFSFVAQEGESGAELLKSADQQDGAYLPEYIVIDQEQELASSAKTTLLQLQSQATNGNLPLGDGFGEHGFDQIPEKLLEKLPDQKNMSSNAGMYFHVQNAQIPLTGQDQSPSLSLRLRSSSVPFTVTTQAVPSPSPNSNSQMKLKINPMDAQKDIAGNDALPTKGVQA